VPLSTCVGSCRICEHRSVGHLNLSEGDRIRFPLRTIGGILPVRRSRRDGIAEVEEHAPGVSGMSEVVS
jgi:hypothetical protein